MPFIRWGHLLFEAFSLIKFLIKRQKTLWVLTSSLSCGRLYFPKGPPWIKKAASDFSHLHLSQDKSLAKIKAEQSHRTLLSSSPPAKCTLAGQPNSILVELLIAGRRFGGRWNSSSVLVKRLLHCFGTIYILQLPRCQLWWRASLLEHQGHQA